MISSRKQIYCRYQRRGDSDVGIKRNQYSVWKRNLGLKSTENFVKDVLGDLHISTFEAQSERILRMEDDRIVKFDASEGSFKRLELRKYSRHHICCKFQE